jgi:hypothetical protein
VRRRHPDVHDYQLGLVLAYERQQVVGVARLSNDLEPGPCEEARESLAEEDVVVCDDDAAFGQRVLDDP